MLTDPFAVKIGAEGNQYMGDLIAFVGASAGAMLGYYNSKTSKAIHPLVFLTHVILISAFYQIVLLWFLFGPSKVLSTDVGYGAFGWLADSQTFWFLILFAAPFNGYLNLVTLFISYYYWPMQIIASTILIVPFASQIVGIVMGQDNIPGFRTILGLFIIASGSFISSYGARLKAIQQVMKFCNFRFSTWQKWKQLNLNEYCVFIQNNKYLCY